MILGLGTGIPMPSGVGATMDGPFSPLDLSPVLWLDASDTSTITEVAGAVSQWDDKSGNGNHVTQGIAANQPTSGTVTLNGLNVIDFDGSTDRLVRTSTDVLRNVSGGTICAVFKGVYTPNFDPIVMATANDSISSSRAVLATGETIGVSNIAAGGRRLDGDAFQAVSTAATNNTEYVVTGLYDYANAELTVRVDGVATVLDPFQTAGATPDTPSRLLIGGNDSASFFDGSIAEVIICETVLSADQIAATETYLADKWGITL